MSHYLSNTRDAPVSVRAQPEEIRTHLRARYPFIEPRPLEAVFDDVAAMLWKWTEHAGNYDTWGCSAPAWIARMSSPR